MRESRDDATFLWPPLAVITKLAMIGVASIVLGLVVPVLAAWHSDVLFYAPMEQRVRNNHRDVASALDAFHKRQAHLKAMIEDLDARVTTKPDANTTKNVIDAALPVTDLATLRQEYQKELMASAPVTIQPLYLHILMYFWPIMFFGLGTTIFVLRPPMPRSPNRTQRTRATLALTVGICLLQYSPLVVRTTLLTQLGEARKVYAYSNPDLSGTCFAVQLFHFAVFSSLLAVIWEHWSEFSVHYRSTLLKSRATTIPDVIYYSQSLEVLSKALTRWQATFAAISVGFVMYTALFWNQIIRYGDARFWVEAIVAHLLWLTTLGLTAIPLALTWHSCQMHKLGVIAAIAAAAEADKTTAEMKFNALHELEPIGTWNVAASLVTVLSSFIGPLLQAFVK